MSLASKNVLLIVGHNQIVLAGARVDF